MRYGKRITYQGETMKISELAESLGLDAQTLRNTVQILGLDTAVDVLLSRRAKKAKEEQERPQAPVLPEETPALAEAVIRQAIEDYAVGFGDREEQFLFNEDYVASGNLTFTDMCEISYQDPEFVRKTARYRKILGKVAHWRDTQKLFKSSPLTLVREFEDTDCPNEIIEDLYEIAFDYKEIEKTKQPTGKRIGFERALRRMRDNIVTITKGGKTYRGAALIVFAVILQRRNSLVDSLSA